MNRKDLNHIIGRTMRALQLAKTPSRRANLREALRNLNDARRALSNGNDHIARIFVEYALREVRLCIAVARAA